MPYVNIKITDEHVQQEQINQLIKETSESLARIINKDPKITFVVIDIVPMEHWGVGGLPVSEVRAQQ